MIRGEFNFELIPCPRCEGQGWLFPWEIAAGKTTVLSCDECEATWLAGEEVSKHNFKYLSEYALSLYSDGHFPNKQDIYQEIKELSHETILEHADNFGSFPKEANDFFVYLSNAFFICECNMSQLCFDRLLADYNRSPSNKIKPAPIEHPTRIIRYNFRYYYDNTSIHNETPCPITADINLFSHIATQGQWQILYRNYGTRLLHLVYDSSEEKLYWYQLQGGKGNTFFDKAVELHNLFYPDFPLK